MKAITEEHIIIPPNNSFFHAKAVPSVNNPGINESNIISSVFNVFILFIMPSPIKNIKNIKITATLIVRAIIFVNFKAFSLLITPHYLHPFVMISLKIMAPPARIELTTNP